MAGPESKFSEKVRGAFEGIGCDVTQVVDAGVPGPPDLILEWPGHHVWLELKVDSPLRPEQRQFLRKRWRKYRNAYLIRLHRMPTGDVYRLWSGDLPLVPGRELWTGSRFDPRAILAAIVSERAVCFNP